MNNLKPIWKRLKWIANFLFTSTSLLAQVNQLSLDSCYAMSYRHYPLIKQFEIIKKTEAYSIQNVNKGYLPQLYLGGHATYQSDVTELPIAIPGVSIETLAKDQYRVYGEISQSLTDVFTKRNDRELTRNQAAIESQKTEVELYTLKQRVSNLFFGILLLDKQLLQNDLTADDLRLAIERTKVSIQNGAAIQSSLDQLQAELLKVQQRGIELNSIRKSFINTLEIYIHAKVGDSLKLETPSYFESVQEVNRPELTLFSYQQSAIDLHEKALENRSLPKLQWFFQSGYGRPALNMLNNDFDSYYLSGFRLNWNITSLYTLKNDRKVLQYNKKRIDVQQDVFLFNTSIQTNQLDLEIAKLRQLIDTDREMVHLREKVVNTAKVQLENGTVTTTDYINYVNTMDQVKQNLMYHEIQLLMTLSSKQITTGN